MIEAVAEAQKTGLAGGRRVDGVRVSKHRVGRFDKASGALLCEWNATQPDPWCKKARARKARKRARRARRLNR